jgi:collagenase-like PrtC family protease
MAIIITKMTELSIGPVLFNWDQKTMEEFYSKVAQEPAIDKVYVGDVICSKRPSFKNSFWKNIIKNLQNSGKKIIFSTLAVVTSESEINSVKEFIENNPDIEIEANDISIFDFASVYSTGQLLNIYNEESLNFLENKGVKEVFLPIEMSFASIKSMAKVAKAKLAVQVFGRMPLALSVRCYHARAYNLNKANCNFVCGNDKNGLDVASLDGNAIFSVNGIQTLSCNYYNLINELDDLIVAGVSNFRLSPHINIDMIAISKIFKNRLGGNISLKEANEKIREVSGGRPDLQDSQDKASFSNGFFYGSPGMAFQ